MGTIRLLLIILLCCRPSPAFSAHTADAACSYQLCMSYRSDDGRSGATRNALIPQENLAQYNRFSPSWCSHVPVRDSKATSRFAPDAAHNVFLRCTVINFLNWRSHAYQTILPPQLPQGFRENFEKSWYVRKRSVEYFQNQFQEKLRELGLHDRHEKSFPHQRAEMRRWWLYNSHAFREFLKGLYVYQDYILEIAAQFEHDAEFARAVAYVCTDAQKWICAEAHRVQCLQRAREIEQAQQQFKQDVHSNFVLQPEWIDSEAYDGFCLAKRAHAESEIKRKGFYCTHQSYALSKEVVELLRTLNVCDELHACYGNQLQQVIHQECVDLIERAAQLKPESPIFEYQSALVYYIGAAQMYNKVGRTYNASIIADFCYTLLDYGKAILEGACDGLLATAQQALDDPLQTMASVALAATASEYVLAYQLGRIVCGVLNLTVNAVINPEQAQKTWDGYITPINSIIDALRNRQLSLRDGIRAGTALAVSMQAQSMLAKGCEKLYSVAKARALTYIAKNPLADPEQCMRVLEGSILCNSYIVEQTQLSKKLPLQPSRFSPHSIQESINWTLKSLSVKGGKLDHIFNKDLHGFNTMLEGRNEDKIQLITKVINELAIKPETPLSGLFLNIPVNIEGYTIHVRGFVHDGIIKIGTMFIP